MIGGNMEAEFMTHEFEGARMSLEGALIDAEQYRPDDHLNESEAEI